MVGSIASNEIWDYVLRRTPQSKDGSRNHAAEWGIGVRKDEQNNMNVQEPEEHASTTYFIFGALR
ncbi:hypothetical protein KI387_018760, partial [Taxus chinensis]